MKFLFKLLVAIVLCNIFCVDIAQAQPFTIKTSSTTMKQGSSITVTITRSSSASEKRWVWIEYIILKKDVGDKPDISGKFYINAPESVFFDEKGVVSFTISAKNAYYDEKLDQRELKIRTSKSNESTELIINKQNSKVVDKSLKRNDKLINSQGTGILLFPEKPKIEIKDGAVFVSEKTTKSISSESIKGFWIQCKLKGYHRTDPSSKEQYFSPKEVFSQDGDEPDRLIYLWIPLVKDNPFRYLATAKYEIGEKCVLGYNSSQTIARIVESGHALNVSKSNSVTQGTHENNSTSSESVNAIEAKLESSIAFSGIGSVGASVSRSGRLATSKAFGFSAERSEGSAFRADYTSSKKTTTHHTRTLRGPETFGFEKNYVAYHPIVTYTVYNSSNENSNVIDLNAIGQYIDYTQNCSLYTGENVDSRCRKSVRNYVNYILETSQFMSELSLSKSDEKLISWKERAPTGVFLNYLKEFPNVKTLNPDILDIGSTINSVNHLVNDIQIYSDAIILFECEVNYSNDTNVNDSYLEIEKPVDCSPITAAPSHQFIDKDGKVVSKFTWNAPVSATEFKLEIKKKDDSWDIPDKVITHPVKRLMSKTNTPIDPCFDDIETRYEPTIYVARVMSKCGASGKWLEYSPELIFSYDKMKCKVGAITATKQPDNTYKVTWKDVPDKLGYYVEYAKSGESFEESKSNLSRTGQVNPFNELRMDTNYTYRGGSSFAIRVVTKCKSGLGPIAEQSFSFEDSTVGEQDPVEKLECPVLSEAPIVNFAKKSMDPTFKWSVPLGATNFKLEIKSKKDSCEERIQTHFIDVEFDAKNNPKSIKFQDDETDYEEGSQYVARVASKCFKISDYWTENYSPEKEFTIPRSKSVKTNSLLPSAGASFAKNAPRNRRSNEPKSSSLPELEPALLIAPNPVTDMLTFSITNLQKPANEIEIRLHGVLLGQVLHSEKRINIGAGEVQFVNKNLSFGHYILVVILDGQKKLTKQFLKQ